MLRKARNLLAHPTTQTTRRIVRRTLAVASVILAVVFVLSLTMDIGSPLRERAETAGTNYLKRTMHIGELSVRIWDGAYVVRNLTIDGRTPPSETSASRYASSSAAAPASSRRYPVSRAASFSRA